MRLGEDLKLNFPWTQALSKHSKVDCSLWACFWVGKNEFCQTFRFVFIINFWTIFDIVGLCDNFSIVALMNNTWWLFQSGLYVTILLISALMPNNECLSNMGLFCDLTLPIQLTYLELFLDRYYCKYIVFQQIAQKRLLIPLS